MDCKASNIYSIIAGISILVFCTISLINKAQGKGKSFLYIIGYIVCACFITGSIHALIRSQYYENPNIALILGLLCTCSQISGIIAAIKIIF